MRALILTAALLLLAAPAWADGVEVFKSTCKATVTAPQTMADASGTSFDPNLNDLKEYGVYVAQDTAALKTAKPHAVKPGALVGAAPFVVVAAAEPDPIPGRTATWDCSGLPLGQHYIQWDAVRITGARSVRTSVVPFVLKFALPPTDAMPSPPTAPAVTGP